MGANVLNVSKSRAGFNLLRLALIISINMKPLNKLSEVKKLTVFLKFD